MGENINGNMVVLMKKLIEHCVENEGAGVTEIIYNGELFSLNQLYSSGHFRTRANLKKKYKKIFTELLADYIFEFKDRFSMIIFYNSRHDPDNITGMAKMFVDVLGEEGRLINDTKKYYKLYAVLPDLELPKNTLHFYLIDHDNKE